jgi:septal ring factor EnvC (AmiA/AmiB activator)
MLQAYKWVRDSGVLVVAVLLVSGCITMPEEVRRQEAARLADEARRQKVLNDLRSDIDQLRERVKTIGVVQEDLTRQLDALSKTAARDQRASQDRLAALDRAIRQLEADRAKLQQQIVSDLSGKMAEIIKTQTPPPPAEPPRRCRAMSMS